MPRTQRRQERQERQATLPDAVPLNTQPHPRPEVRIEQLGEGCIVWLPAKDENEARAITCIRDSCCSNRELTKEAYNHPVLWSIIREGPLGFRVSNGRNIAKNNMRDMFVTTRR